MMKTSFKVMIGVLMIVMMTFLVYTQAIQGDFVWDDEHFVKINSQWRGLKGLQKIWLDVSWHQYYPLHHTSFWLEYYLWGFNPQGYHLDNVALHTVNAILVWALLEMLKLPYAWFMAALFALHPVHVESVGWITERKNVLSGMFYLLSLITFLKISLKQEALPGQGVSGRLYVLSLFFFLCALFSKTVTCTLPVILFLILWWKKDRVGKQDIFLFLPFFILGVCMAPLTIWLEKTAIGAQGPEWQFSFLERSLIAGRALWFYPSKLLFPYPLIFIYPRWKIESMAFGPYLFPLGFVVVLVGLWLGQRKWGKGPLVAILCYAVTIFPALGFFNVYPMRYTFVADHYQYLASIGLIVLFVSLLGKILLNRRLFYGLSGILLLSLAVITLQRGGIYKNQIVFYQDILKKNPSCDMAHVNLGRLYRIMGKPALAYQHYQNALEINPKNSSAHLNLGVFYELKGEWAKAEASYQSATIADPRSVRAHYNLGVLYQKQRRFEAAEVAFRKALSLNPDFVHAQTNLGIVYFQIGQTQEAIQAYQKVLSLDPNFVLALYNLGVAYEFLGQRQKASQLYQKVIDLQPDFQEARRNLNRLEGQP